MKWAASREKDFVRYWYLIIDDDIPEHLRPDYVGTVNEIQQALDSDGSWRDMGYQFKNICLSCGLAMRQNKKHWKYCIEVHLSLPSTIKKICKFDGLSCADLSINVIYFNLDRWLYGSVQSGLTRERYMRYVILHEFGHLLGRGHQTPRRGELCPIMYQQTISDGSCIPNTRVLEYE